MTLFYIGVVALVFMACGFILWPLLKFRRVAVSGDQVRRSTNIALYQDHVNDIQQLLDDGSITLEQHEQLTLELERNLLADSQASVVDKESVQAGRKTGGYILGALVCVSLVLGGLIYTQLGAYRAWQVKQLVDQRQSLQQQYVSASSEVLRNTLQIDVLDTNRRLVTLLAKAVQQSPNNLQMQVLLARTATELGRYNLAITHFQAALKQDPKLTVIMAELAQVIFIQAGSKVIPVVQQLVDQTLTSDPNNTIALGLAGISAFQSQDYQQAIRFWQQAIRIQGPNSVNSIALQQGITTAKARLGKVDSAPDTSTEGDNSSQIRIQVAVAQGVSLAPSDTVFVYARAWQGAKMPLAIARLTADQLPVSITLNNTMSMAPGMNLGSAEQLELVVRVSASGSPIAQSGDWQATQGPVNNTTNTEPYQLLINQQLP